MGYLGKLVKGKANRPEQKRVMVRVKNIDKGLDDIEKEQKILQQRKQELKKKMMEEEKMTHFNRMKILTHWRKLLRLAKTEQLKKEIQIYQQNHDREVDAKDAILQMLDRDLDEAEEQY
jgi:dynein regulatory complex subunit 2